MEWRLKNLDDYKCFGFVSVESNDFGGWHLWIRYLQEQTAKVFDDYNFKTDISAKRYFSKNFRNKNSPKAIWSKP